MQIFKKFFNAFGVFVCAIFMGAGLGGIHWANVVNSVNLERNAVCEEHISILQEQLRTLQKSFAFKFFSWFLPEAPHFEDCVVAAQQDSFLEAWLKRLPIIGRFLKAADRVKRCELGLRQMEMEAARFNDQLNSNWLFRRILPQFNLGEGEECISYGNRNHVYIGVAAVAAVSAFAAGILLVKNRKSKEEIKDNYMEELDEISGCEGKTEELVYSTPIEDEMTMNEEINELKNEEENDLDQKAIVAENSDPKENEYEKEKEKEKEKTGNQTPPDEEVEISEVEGISKTEEVHIIRSDENGEEVDFIPPVEGEQAIKEVSTEKEPVKLAKKKRKKKGKLLKAEQSHGEPSKEESSDRELSQEESSDRELSQEEGSDRALSKKEESSDRALSKEESSDRELSKEESSDRELSKNYERLGSEDNPEVIDYGFPIDNYWSELAGMEDID